jgi:hypothetical protein
MFRSLSKTAVPISDDLSKIILAVHGIGDQFRYATIQLIAARFGIYSGVPARVPLGGFHPQAQGAIEAFYFEPPPKPPYLAGIGFAEVYWADIPRGPQKEGYIIEEAKSWGRAVVERIRTRYSEVALDLKPKDYELTAEVVSEMIETISILGNLLFLAEKAGVVKFDLDNLLVTYLGDVQIVAEFRGYRAQIIDQFAQVMAKLHERHPKAELYVIAHSEGTVVSFIGLLTAISSASPPAWLNQVRGFMTIGSPIDKHLVLWPKLFDGIDKQVWTGEKIKWRNYYDYGDPVGFELETTRQWLTDHGITAFDFNDNDEQKRDFGFSRYPLPGKAHNDYWDDADVFGHFIQTVVEPLTPHQTAVKPPMPGTPRRDFSKPPQSKVSSWLISWVVPYVIALAILSVGVFLLHKGVDEFRDGKTSLKDLAANSAGTVALLAATTVLARIPRLTAQILWRVIAVIVFLVGASISCLLLNQMDWVSTLDAKLLPIEWVKALTLKYRALPIVCTAFLVAIMAWWIGRSKPAWGMAPLLIPGVLVVAGIVALIILEDLKESKIIEQPLWPLLLAGGAFFYLWWLAALLFDLVFTWHRYIRYSVAPKYVSDLRKKLKTKRAKENAEA